MEKTSAWAALYFVALMTFGNYVLFNLLVAILVEGFSSEVCKIISYSTVENDFWKQTFIRNFSKKDWFQINDISHKCIFVILNDRTK